MKNLTLAAAGAVALALATLSGATAAAAPVSSTGAETVRTIGGNGAQCGFGRYLWSGGGFDAHWNNCAGHNQRVHVVREWDNDYNFCAGTDGVYDLGGAFMVADAYEIGSC